MKKIINSLLAGLTLLTIITARADDNEAVKKDIAALQGDWTMVSGERDGTLFSADFMKDSTRVAKGNETTVTIQGQLFMKAKFTLDPSKHPKTIDYAVNGGSYSGKTQLGIYELDDDKVKFCFATPNKDRPVDFTAKAGSGRTLAVWKKLKK